MHRRRFLRALGAAGATALVGLDGAGAAAEPPPETTKLRLMRTNSMCWAPQYVADDLLKAEGFTDVRYFEAPLGQPVSKALVAGDADLSMNFVAPNLMHVDRGDPNVFL